MAHKKFDLVQETSTSTGSTTMALAGASSITRRRFGTVLANGETCYVLIEHAMAAEYQICKATWNTGHTLTLGTVLMSSTGSAVSFSAGTKTISMVAPAAKSIVEDDNGDVSVTRDLVIGRNASASTGLTIGGVTQYQPLSVKTGMTGVHTSGGSDAKYWDFFQDASGLQLRFLNDAYSAAGQISTVVRSGYSVVSQTWYYSVGSTGLVLSSAGHFGIGVAPSYRAHIHENAAAASYLYHDNSSTHPSAQTVFTQICGGRYVNRTVTYSGQFLLEQGVNGIIARYSDFDVQLFRDCAGTGYFVLNPTNARPIVDNSMAAGHASFRYSVIYAATGTINTSGREAKMFIEPASDAERRAAARIKANPRRYKLAEAVEAKGEARARWHFGYIAEDVRDALAAEGLDPWAYAFLCSDPIVKNETYSVIMYRAKVRKVTTKESAVEIIDGKPVMVSKDVERDEPVGEVMPVLDEAGRAILHQVGTTAEGEPVVEPQTYFVPETEEYQVERTREVATDEVRLGLRYSELEAFLRSAD